MTRIDDGGKREATPGSDVERLIRVQRRMQQLLHRHEWLREAVRSAYLGFCELATRHLEQHDAQRQREQELARELLSRGLLVEREVGHNSARQRVAVDALLPRDVARELDRYVTRGTVSDDIPESLERRVATAIVATLEMSEVASPKGLNADNVQATSSTPDDHIREMRRLSIEFLVPGDWREPPSPLHLNYQELRRYSDSDYLTIALHRLGGLSDFKSSRPVVTEEPRREDVRRPAVLVAAWLARHPFSGREELCSQEFPPDIAEQMLGHVEDHVRTKAAASGAIAKPSGTVAIVDGPASEAHSSHSAPKNAAGNETMVTTSAPAASRMVIIGKDWRHRVLPAVRRCVELGELLVDRTKDWPRRLDLVGRTWVSPPATFVDYGQAEELSQLYRDEICSISAMRTSPTESGSDWAMRTYGEADWKERCRVNTGCGQVAGFAPFASAQMGDFVVDLEVHAREGLVYLRDWIKRQPSESDSPKQGERSLSPVRVVPDRVVLWEGAEYSERNVRLARTRTAYLEAHGDVVEALAALKAAGHKISRRTFYNHLAALDKAIPRWRAAVLLCNGPAQMHSTRKQRSPGKTGDNQG